MDLSDLLADLVDVRAVTLEREIARRRVRPDHLELVLDLPVVLGAERDLAGARRVLSRLHEPLAE